MAAVNWPTSLQQRLLEANFGLQFGDPTITSDVDAGMPKKRARYTSAPDVVNGSILLTIPQFLIFQNFFKVQLNYGVTTFNYNHPITQVASVWRFEGQPQISSIGGGNFTVTFQWKQVS